jgi:hypothetical protein
MSISVLCVTRGEAAERCCRIQGVPMQDPPSDYLDVATIPAGDGAI